MKKCSVFLRPGHLKEQQRVVAPKKIPFVEGVNVTEKNRRNSVIKMIWFQVR